MDNWTGSTTAPGPREARLTAPINGQLLQALLGIKELETGYKKDINFIFTLENGPDNAGASAITEATIYGYKKEPKDSGPLNGIIDRNRSYLRSLIWCKLTIAP
jgi:hypothetical protein